MATAPPEEAVPDGDAPKPEAGGDTGADGEAPEPKAEADTGELVGYEPPCSDERRVATALDSGADSEAPEPEAGADAGPDGEAPEPVAGADAGELMGYDPPCSDERLSAIALDSGAMVLMVYTVVMTITDGDPPGAAGASVLLSTADERT